MKYPKTYFKEVFIGLIVFAAVLVLSFVVFGCDFKCTMCGERSYGEPVYLDGEYLEMKHVPLCGRCSSMIVEWRKIGEAQMELVTKKLREGK